MWFAALCHRLQIKYCLLFINSDHSGMPVYLWNRPIEISLAIDDLSLCGSHKHFINRNPSARARIVCCIYILWVLFIWLFFEYIPAKYRCMHARTKYTHTKPIKMFIFILYFVQFCRTFNALIYIQHQYNPMSRAFSTTIASASTVENSSFHLIWITLVIRICTYMYISTKISKQNS